MNARDHEVSAICDRLDALALARDDEGLCCLSDDCTAPVVFELRADCEEHYCEAHGPLEVLALIATPSTAPKHIDLVRLDPRNFALTSAAA